MHSEPPFHRLGKLGVNSHVKLFMYGCDLEIKLYKFVETTNDNGSEIYDILLVQP